MTLQVLAVGVGAGGACDLLAVLKIAQEQDQKIAACGSSYTRLQTPMTLQVLAVGVGAGGACDLLAVLEIAQEQDQKIAACGSSYGGTRNPRPAGRPPRF